ncbi:MAG: hypothetical protein V4547_08950 [Bacteroidota bacterium]
MDLNEIKAKNEYYERVIAQCIPPDKDILLRIIESIEIPIIPSLRGKEEFKTAVFIVQTFEKWKSDSINLINK